MFAAAMAAKSSFSAVLRHWSLSRNPKFSSQNLLPFSLFVGDGPSRPFSPGPSRNEDALADDSDPDGDLRSRIFRLRFPKRSATNALDRWVNEGGKVTVPELRGLTNELRRAQRYKHALEILSWVESKHVFRLSSRDHAIKLELIEKIHGLDVAEAYFVKLKDCDSKKAACIPLLHCYVRNKDTVRAETFMESLKNLGFLVIPEPFNEMMKLYISTGQYEKVVCVIQKMNQANISKNVLSYNLLLNASNEVFGTNSVERVYKEMLNDKHVTVGWSTYATLANIYTKSGSHDKAFAVLRTAEGTLSIRNRLGYIFLITLYANLQDKGGVFRVWDSSKRVAGRITCANYMCIILCFLKVGLLEEAEKVFETWESECKKYDIRVSNVLLGAYVRKGWIEKAEALHLHTMEKGGSPNYKTWEILMEGWVKTKQMDKAVEAMKKGVSLLKDCHWRPPLGITMAIAEYFEERNRLQDAKKYVEVLRCLDAMNLPLYKSFLRMHLKAQTPSPDVLEMMERDKVSPDEEMLALVQQVFIPS